MTSNRLDIDRATLAARLTTPPPDRHEHHVAARLLVGYRGGILLDIVRHAVSCTGPDAVSVDWAQLARFADDMAGAHGTDRQRAAYEAGASRTAARYILAAAAGIALGEITPVEAQALADAFTTLGQQHPPT